MNSHALLLAILAAAAPAPEPTALCLAVAVPMPRFGQAELDEEARARLRRFFRASPIENPTARAALADPRIRVVIAAPYGWMRGFEQNQRLTRERGRVIRDFILSFGVAAERIDIVELTDSLALFRRAGIPLGEQRDGYVLLQYPGPGVGATAPSCQAVFSR